MFILHTKALNGYYYINEQYDHNNIYLRQYNCW